MRGCTEIKCGSPHYLFDVALSRSKLGAPTNVGAVEPRRGCDSGGSGDIFSDYAAVIAASLKLDSSHKGLAVDPGFQSG